MQLDAWDDILSQLSTKVSRPNFNTWLKPTRLVSDTLGEIVIATPNLYGKDWLEKNLTKELAELLAQRYDNFQNLKIIIKSPASTNLDKLPLLRAPEPTESSEPSESKPSAPNPFNPKYTFETFIVGNNNRLAFAASQVVAEKPGEVYNPLFIYGGVGLGKTHLMQAVGNEIYKRNPKKKILYTSCETFASEFIQALQNKSMNEFKKNYRSVDVFLIDDIQFLSNKEGTQEEFFHTFNILHQANRQIIITSDRVPKEIPALEERLSSRFGWGMIADIQSPNFENRLAILGSKAEEKGYQIKPEVLEFIANTITSNVRELEGSLTKLVTAASLEGTTIDIAFTAAILKDLIQTTPSNLTSKKIINTVISYFKVELGDILGPKRVKGLVYPRQLIMYLLRQHLKLSHAQIGELLGGKDHTTVMHSVDKITEELKSNPKVEEDVRQVQQLLYS